MRSLLIFLLTVGVAAAETIGCGPQPVVFNAGDSLSIGPSGLTLCSTNDGTNFMAIQIGEDMGTLVEVTGKATPAVVLPVWPPGTLEGDEHPANLYACPGSGGACTVVPLAVTFRENDLLYAPGRARALTGPE